MQSSGRDWMLPASGPHPPSHTHNGFDSGSAHSGARISDPLSNQHRTRPLDLCHAPKVATPTVRPHPVNARIGRYPNSQATATSTATRASASTPPDTSAYLGHRSTRNTASRALRFSTASIGFCLRLGGFRHCDSKRARLQPCHRPMFRPGTRPLPEGSGRAPRLPAGRRRRPDLTPQAERSHAPERGPRVRPLWLRRNDCSRLPSWAISRSPPPQPKTRNEGNIGICRLDPSTNALFSARQIPKTPTSRVREKPHTVVATLDRICPERRRRSLPQAVSARASQNAPSVHPMCVAPLRPVDPKTVLPPRCSTFTGRPEGHPAPAVCTPDLDSSSRV
jgi:hypothetical protein